MRGLNDKEKGELRFWINHYHGGCMDETGKSFIDQWSEGARGRLALYRQYLSGPADGISAVWVDVGTGPYSLLMKAPQDVTKIMIDPLMKHYMRYGLLSPADAPPHSVFLEGFGEDLPVVSETADFVACTNALDHVNDPWATASELARILKTGGSLALEVDTDGDTDYLHPHALGSDAIDSEFARLGLIKVSSFRPETQGRRRPGAQLYYAFYRRETSGRDSVSSATLLEEFLQPVLVLEGLHGFNVVKLHSPGEGDIYYGLQQRDGPFYYRKVLAGAYSLLFTAPSLEDVQEQIRRYHFTHS